MILAQILCTIGVPLSEIKVWGCVVVAGFYILELANFRTLNWWKVDLLARYVTGDLDFSPYGICFITIVNPCVTISWVIVLMLWI